MNQKILPEQGPETINPPLHPSGHERRNILFFAAVLIALVIGVIHASALWYVNDDCFVSFRYARNFIRGIGLVYNAEERVEGYTNFLWTIIIAGGLKLNINPVTFANTLGIVFFALTLGLYGFLGWKFRSSSPSGMFLLPFTPFALALHRDFCAHATSGMETSMFSFLVSASFAVLLTGTRKRSALAAGLLLVAAMMTRPDGIVFLGAAGLYLLITNRSRIPWLAAPVILLFLPYWFWRYQYYGLFFPNTFYAKSINLPYYSQGINYTWLYFKTYYILFLLPVIGLWMLVRMRKKSAGKQEAVPSLPSSGNPFLLGSLYVILYILFVIRIGGDFMFARFFIAVTPVMYFMMELLIRRIPVSRNVRLALPVLIILATLFRWDQYGDNLFVGYVADEARYFTPAHQEQSEADGALLKKYFEGLPVRLAFWAGQLKLVYYIDPVYAIEASGGLTDTAIAHRPIGTRGRPGHEKQPTTDDLLRRNIHFYIGPVDRPPQGQMVLNAIVFDQILARIIIYDNRIMNTLAKNPDIHFIKFPEYLDRYIAGIGTMPREKVQRDFEYFTSYYFSHNTDTAHEMPIRRTLESGIQSR